jgi:hypothetical protein
MQTKPTTLDRFSVQVDSTEGGNHEKIFATKAEAMRYAKEEVLWESTLFVQVLDEETGEKLFNERGSFNSDIE